MKGLRHEKRLNSESGVQYKGAVRAYLVSSMHIMISIDILLMYIK